MSVLKIRNKDGGWVSIPAIKGEKGDNGLTPFINDEGNWQIGEEDTGIKAAGTNGINGTNGTNGTNGLTPYINDSGNWQIGDEDTGIQAAGVNGTNGDSAYDIAKKSGFEGTEEDWLISLKGEPGKKGDPFTYEDFTEEQLESLKGEAGNSGVYVGSGEMPDDCNVQIDLEGGSYTEEDLALQTLPIIMSKLMDGFILKDVSTNKLYKLYVDNGKLSLKENE